MSKKYKAAEGNLLSIKLVGADLDEDKPAWGEVAERTATGEVVVKKSGTITLKLANLKVYEPVKLTPTMGGKDLEGTVCLPVCSNDNPLRGTLCLPVCPPKSN